MEHFRAAAGLTANFDGRTVDGLLVPYNAPQEVNAPGFRGREAYAPGAFDHQIRSANRIPLFLDHGPLGGKIIGRLSELRSETSGKNPGLYGTAIVSDTADGRDALALMRDGVYPDFSVGFSEVRNRNLPDGTIMREKANMFELAVVRQGAIKGAAIAGIRTEACPVCGAAKAPDAASPSRARLEAEIFRLRMAEQRW